ncbi:alpha/beta hydrolase family protein [Corynebacterium striatum]|uniref:alpha/beta hydrolase family protein n=1 Tax=Corynebacterium striatum TaxID=43770 RepID=UPI000D721688|nr:alpha/beta fold hydrolase [Corynebacterium striatum]MDK8789641.1 alpha/beta fold hydrolase [Corynebacterium striatum]MDK8808888.1 alpha/beta fold hydrolase [Corynebacterium striatum]MDK8833580.1 alpha/beta fold hydrolase [Corynebacterium striatum]PXY15267.1 hypothetical protein CKF74_01015 [Corynebacterium striatum]PXY16255.1 hypothetical protein CKF62_01540 [Corynebacterium striatum]
MSKGVLRSCTPAIAAALTLLAGFCVSCADNSAGSGESGMEHSASQAPATQKTKKPEVSAKKLVYAHEHERQHGFLVTPKKPQPGKKLPLVVFLHGGGWQEKSTAQSAAPAVNDLVEHGAAVWNVEYRGVSIDGEDAPGGWPMTYQDVAAAIDFIPQLANHSDVPLDLNNVVVAGYSAGGNLATWTCSRPELAPDAPGAHPAFPVDKCVGIAGVYDMELAYQQHDKFVRTLLGGTPQEVPAHYFDASPAYNVNKKARVLVLHGENDEMVNVDEVTRFADYAKQRGLNIDAIIFDDAKHLSWANPAGLQWQQARRNILEQVGIKS